MNSNAKTYVLLILVLVLAAGAYYGYDRLREHGPGEGFASGNGRIEATEIDVATKLAGRIEDMLVAEGEFVKAGQLLARMQVQGLQAQRAEALARQQQAQQAVSGAEAQVASRESDHQACLLYTSPSPRD